MAIAAEVAASNAAIASRRSDPRLNNGQVRARISSIAASGTMRGPADVRRTAQERTAASARTTDHHHRLVPADIGHPGRSCRPSGRQDRRRPSTSGG